MKGIARVLILGASVFVAYKVGEKKAQLNSVGFYVTRTIEPSPGVQITEFVQITPTGVIDYTADQEQGTSFYFGEAIKLKSLIKRYTPGAELQLLTSETLNLI